MISQMKSLMDKSDSEYETFCDIFMTSLFLRTLVSRLLCMNKLPNIKLWAATYFKSSFSKQKGIIYHFNKNDWISLYEVNLEQWAIKPQFSNLIPSNISLKEITLKILKYYNISHNNNNKKKNRITSLPQNIKSLIFFHMCIYTVLKWLQMVKFWSGHITYEPRGKVTYPVEEY